MDEVNAKAGPPDMAARRTAIHHARLSVKNGVLVFERDIAMDLPLLRRSESADS
jgi:hypothetical protein